MSTLQTENLYFKQNNLKLINQIKQQQGIIETKEERLKSMKSKIIDKDNIIKNIETQVKLL